jgi:hypothetical protein
VRDSPAYGARNVSRVAAGTGEALPGPVACGVCRRFGFVKLQDVDGFGELAGAPGAAAEFAG